MIIIIVIIKATGANVNQTEQQPYKDFFLNPASTTQRDYEVLRARIVEQVPVKTVAQRFGLSLASVNAMVSRFYKEMQSQDPPEFFVRRKRGPKGERKKSPIRARVVALRQLGYADTDIHKALKKEGIQASVSLIDTILREEGLEPLKRRSAAQRSSIKAQIDSDMTQPTPVKPETPVVADVRRLDFNNPQSLYTRVAGIFLFMPLLVQAKLDRLAADAGMPGSKMIPPVSYLLSLLSLKLLDKERKSHISDWNFDEALGLFAGLNIMPKNTATSDYSYRLNDRHHEKLLADWVRAAHPILCPNVPAAFAVDFHPIAHRGVDTGLPTNFVPMRGERLTSIQTCFARAVDSPMLCFARADITPEAQSGMVVEFIKFWNTIAGVNPDWLYFDSQTTTYEHLQQLNKRGINFITIRQRGEAILRALRVKSSDQWKPANIQTPQRRHQQLRYVDETVKMPGTQLKLRQIAVDGLGREEPTLFITNNTQIPASQVVTRYIMRNSIENELGININFFHMNCLSSEVRLNVSTDVIMTVIANNCYRWLSQQLKGCEKMEPKQLYRKFIETAGTVSIEDDLLHVQLDRRSHNPIIAQANLDTDSQPIPWLNNKRLKISFK